MNLIELAEISEEVEVASEYLFLPPGDGLEVPSTSELPELPEERVELMRSVAEEAIGVIGLGDVLETRDGRYDFIPKLHEDVSLRDAAVAEQFFHVDVAFNNYCGILMVGIEGKGPKSVPETQMVDNAAMFEHVQDKIEGGPLEDRIGDVLVVRPYLGPGPLPKDSSDWMDYPRHVLSRLRLSPFRELLTQAQLEHADEATKELTDESLYRGDVFISKLLRQSIIDGSPLIACGAGSREIRLALQGGQNDEETEALDELYDDIALYLLANSVKNKPQTLLRGSAMFIPLDQPHRATPYDPSEHRRSAIGVRFYAASEQYSPPSWQKASGTQY